MAEMIDSMPTEYKGEEMVFQSINELPNDIVCYNHREVMGKEFDFCLLINPDYFSRHLFRRRNILLKKCKSGFRNAVQPKSIIICLIQKRITNHIHQ